MKKKEWINKKDFDQMFYFIFLFLFLFFFFFRDEADGSSRFETFCFLKSHDKNIISKPQKTSLKI